MSRKKIIITSSIIIIAAIIYSSVLYFKGQSDIKQDGSRIEIKNIHQHNNQKEHYQMQQDKEIMLSGSLQDGVRVIAVRAFKYGFAPDPIVVKLGEKVRLEAISDDVAHGLAIKDFGINLTVLSDKIKSVEFTANKSGLFNIYCSVYCGPGHGKMQGRLRVIE